MRLLLLARHGQSVFNVAGVVNGDPALDQGLSEAGRAAAEALEIALAALPIELCVTSRFPRAQETARLALGSRAAEVPRVVDADLDDIRIGELEGRPLADYRAWKHAHTRADRFPGGESLDDAAARYADAFERLAARPEDTILCVCHEIPVRYAVNAAAGSTDPDAPFHDVPNATPYLFDEQALRRAAVNLRA
ncbi:MAG TPA: histidine phosphatase family protein [Gaiellaceae bacterium]|nr:histidine phosphatase family protein [Gaiellaceae bacterium]